MEGIELAQEVGDKYSIAQLSHNLGAWNQSRNANWEEAERHYQECLSAFREIDNIAGITFELLHLSFVVFLMKKDTDNAIMYLNEALTSCREYNLSSYIVNILSILSAVTYISDQPDEAQTYTEEVLQLLQEYSHSFDESPTFLGHSLCGMGNCQAARIHLFEGLSLTHYSGDSRMMLFTILGIALLKTNDKQHVRATELVSLVCNHQLTPEWWHESYADVSNAISDLKKEMGEDAYNTVWENGKALDLDTVVKELLAEYEEG